MGKQQLALAVMSAVIGCAPLTTQAAFDENLNNYTLDTVVVEATALKNQFGDTITEQSYYRTDGDVKVITREEIEKRHYMDLTEAIKRVPGITFHNPGYRGGEYGYEFYNNGISINGDSRVVILIDGRRVDNSTSVRMGSSSVTGTKSTGVNLDQLTNMENIEKIEVIKGPGASAYGQDALGGVINIITRKGGDDQVISLDVATGSWDRHHMALSINGSAGDDGTLRYALSANRDMSGDSKYKDSVTGENGTLGDSNWREQGLNLRLDKEFGDKQNLKIWYNYRSGRDGYPIAVPSMKYWNEKDWKRIIFNAEVGQVDENYKLIPLKDKEGNVIVDEKTGLPKFGKLAGDAKNPGYHNLYALDGRAYGAFSKFTMKGLDVVFAFDKVHDMESFVRLYDQDHRFAHRDKYVWTTLPSDWDNPSANFYHKQFPNGTTAEEFNKWVDENLAPFPGGDPQKLKEWVDRTGGRADDPNSWYEEKNRGIQLQYAAALGQHDILGSVTFDRARTYSKRIKKDKSVDTSYIKRTWITGFVQDKIHVSDNLDITPSVRWAKYSSFDTVTSAGETKKGKGEESSVTPAMHMQYLLNDDISTYLGWTKIHRPLRRGDYTKTDGVFKIPLEDEKGYAITAGITKKFGENTSLAVHYDWTHMDNAIARLPIVTPEGPFATAVNAKQEKQSFNITLDHQFSDHFSASLAYSRLRDEWKAKSGWVLDPSWGYSTSSDINANINNLRPANYYSLNLNYENGKVYSGLLINWYTGNNLNAFSKRQFLVLDWSLNYDINQHASAYMLITNLTNEAYETSFNAWNGIASSAMPGRMIMGGMKYTF